MSERKRILITGATGFIGAYLVSVAREAGLDVWIAIRPESNRQRAEKLGATIIELDYADEAGMELAMRQHLPADGSPLWHYIIHNAGLTKAVDVREFYEANAENTRRLCSSLYRLGILPERFLLMSSMSTYSLGDNRDGIIRADGPQRPTTQYGRSKVLAEQYVRESGLPYTILAPTGVYGPGDEDYLMAVKSIQNGINFMAGLKPQTLTFVYGEDVARAAIFLVQNEQAKGNAYLISDGDTYTDQQFGEIVKELLGRAKTINLRAPLPIVWCICQLGSLWASLTGKSVTLNKDKYPLMAERSWRCDVSPLMSLGWRPTHTLREGLRRLISSAQAQGKLR